MYENNKLNYAIYGKVTDQDDQNSVGILGLSGELTPKDAEQWRDMVAIAPLPGDSEEASQAVGIFEGPGQDFLFARSYYKDGSIEQPVYQYILLPQNIVTQMSGNLELLLEHVSVNLPNNNPIEGDPLDLEELPVPALPTWTADKRAAALEQLRRGDDKYLLLAFRILDAALSDEHALVQNFEPNGVSRLELMQGLAMMLPFAGRPTMTFSTNVDVVPPVQPRIVFSDTPAETPRIIVNAADLDEEVPARSSYVQYLENVWNGDIDSLMAALREIEATAGQLVSGMNVLDNLDTLVQRQELNSIVLSEDGEVSAHTLKSVLQGQAPPPPGNLRERYAERLLNYCLAEHDVESVHILGQLMREDHTLEARLREILENAQEGEPDAVYFFVRTLLADGIDENWLPLLQSAATQALNVAIEDGDNETISEWLRLIVREPAGYELGDVLQQGILTAQERTHEDGDLGVRLIKFVSRRRPNLIDVLLEDQPLLDALAAPLGAALRDYELESFREAIEQGRELSLVLLGRAAQDANTNPQAAQVFTPSHVEHLWTLYMSDSFDQMPSHYQPANILRSIVMNGISLSQEAVDALLLYIVITEIDEAGLSQELLTSLAQKQDISESLVAVFYQDNVSPERVIELTTLLLENEAITHQKALDMFLSLADNLDWPPETLPLAEQIGRLIQLDSSLSVPSGALWRILELGADAKTELISRPVTRRLTSYLNESDDTAQIVEMLTRLHTHTQWSGSVYTYLMNWWRTYAGDQPLTRLHQLDKALEGKRALEPFRAVIQTTVAIRKMMSNRSLEDFAHAISGTYSLLQAISDSFDPDSRQSLSFDAATVRAELDNQEANLTPNEISVLAKNLKELAQLIITMSEHRSKAGLIRREEDIERQLLAGEQQPQSAIDTLKWLSGYFNEKLNQHEE